MTLRITDQAYATDTGRQRSANEDSVFVRAPLFVIADGMGGARAGEVASKTVVDAFDRPLPEAPPERVLKETIEGANRTVYSLARKDPNLSGMGTTTTAAILVEPIQGEGGVRPCPPGFLKALRELCDANGDPRVALMAANVTDSLVDGLSRIPNIRVLAPVRSAGPTEVSARTEKADLILRGELQQVDKSWNLQARIIDAATNEVRWTTSFAVDASVSPALQQSRLTAGVGYPLAVRISSLIHSDFRRRNADVVVDQAQAFINRTSREKSKTAQEMLEKALAADPDNVDLQAALAAQLLRGIQTAWYRDAEAEAAENRARGLLESAIKREPNYMPLLEGYCRFLAATNHFVDSLIACAKALNQDPWDGLVLFQVGLSSPVFYVGLVLLTVFAAWLRWFPVGGYGEGFADIFWHLLLPAVTLALSISAVIMRNLRASVLEVLNAEFVEFARAKGLPRRVVLVRHVLRNALISTVTLVGLHVGSLLGGAVVTESVFAWPGAERHFHTLPATVIVE